MTCRKWLRENGYEDVASLIDDAMAKMAARGTKQRRNWWEILAGGLNGRPCIREGIEFPVLVVAQKHENKPVTANAIQRSLSETAPSIRRTGRWPKKRRRR